MLGTHGVLGLGLLLGVFQGIDSYRNLNLLTYEEKQAQGLVSYDIQTNLQTNLLTDLLARLGLGLVSNRQTTKETN